MAPEVFYIVVAMMLVSATLSVIFFIAWKTLGEKPYAMSWSIGFLGAALQWFFTLQRDWFPSFETYWLTVNSFALVLITLGLRGHCQRTNCKHLPKNLWPFAGVIYAGIVWTTAINPHVGVSVALVPAAACVTLFLSALMVIRHREKPRPAEWAAASSIVLFSVTQGIAAGMALLQSGGGDSSYQALYISYNFMTLPAGYMAMGMFIIFMLASDISIDMKEIAIHDQLTGVLNRRGLGEQGAQIYAMSRRMGRPVSVIMTDIDKFKNINDEHGHAIGDAALAHFSNLLKDERRADDIIARVGGEEFALILPGTALESAMDIAGKLRATIENKKIRVEGLSLSMTASLGVAAITDKDTCLSDTITRADRALYRSKRAGRNQVDLESSQLMVAADGSLKPISA
jgi:diguanylate cyclase (GGDEF)-like protein